MHVNNQAMDGRRVLLAAHRGDRTHFPENTMPAIEAAVALGCDMIETDIHMTAGGELVLLHDRDVKRTTDGEGLVDRMTLAQVRALDAGSWFSPDFKGARIPTVEEFARYIAPTGLLINWELKDYPGEVGDKHAFTCADKLVEILERYGLEERSMLNSFSERVLEYIADKWPGRFVLHGQGINGCSRRKDLPSRPVESFIDWVCMYGKTPEHPAGRKEDYDYALQRGIIPCICFADTEENYALALELGCRMFTSNDPAEGLKILEKLGQR